MKHLKKFPINDKSQKLSKDMKKQDLVKPKKDKQLDAEKSLSEKPRFSKRFSKPSNKKLSSEKFLSGKKATKVNESAPIPELEYKFMNSSVYSDYSNRINVIFDELENKFYEFCKSEGFDDPEGDTDIDMTFGNIKSEIISRY